MLVKPLQTLPVGIERGVFLDRRAKLGEVVKENLARSRKAAEGSREVKFRRDPGRQSVDLLLNAPLIVALSYNTVSSCNTLCCGDDADVFCPLAQNVPFDVQSW